ncbi:hypothetical protein CAPTEDRAFT_216300 [Capitella teleta]|uniref:Uncharacterized protein n=1 Tax=Capitella teleta TaxID=283909 RepID=R7UKW5_CAPTE|nr:hypothetical protein CAPTEDRAFT_216300 [Capitella teleta]|eukprot:ELU03902.1 hypothetical protein CAPTEDRAFT_216300 [Capitella teleta]
MADLGVEVRMHIDMNLTILIGRNFQKVVGLSDPESKKIYNTANLLNRFQSRRLQHFMRIRHEIHKNCTDTIDGFPVDIDRLLVLCLTKALPNTQVTWEEKAECFTCRHKRRPENMLTCCVNHEKIGPLSYKQATLVVAFVSMIFDALILVHELVVEGKNIDDESTNVKVLCSCHLGGFDYRNYVAVALCIVWVVVTCLLLLGLHKRANFLLLPWMVFICMLTPLFMIAIVAGTKVIRRCTEDHIPEACTHEYHIFGTKDATAASLRLTLLITILIFNSASIFVVYKYFMILSDQDKDPSKVFVLLAFAFIVLRGSGYSRKYASTFSD